MDATHRHGGGDHGEGARRDAGQRSAAPGAEPASPRELSFAARKEQQLVFLLTRQLVEAQIVCADLERSQRLWQEVAALELDPDRITALIYGVGDHDDRCEMEAVDRLHASGRGQHNSPWFSWGHGTLPTRWRGAGRRGAPPAAPRAHRQAR